VRLWFDEDLSPTLVQVAARHGFVATCNRDRGMLRANDHELRRVVQAEGFVLVTANDADFRPMFARDAIHPGLLVLPGTAPRERQHALLRAVLDYVVGLAREAAEQPGDFMVNRLVDIDKRAECSVRELPNGG
jgi:predicted nuclease of predicted toxin-antitoxin system